ncbi:MAG: 3-oxoacyl-ACP reductase, partial [Acidobacteria bacterium]|nr:3-oxoacyl-ACP reductase [Acidobacteriota bacterium]
MFNFKEKVVLISGASRGIGAAAAVRFAEAGDWDSALKTELMAIK